MPRLMVFVGTALFVTYAFLPAYDPYWKASWGTTEEAGAVPWSLIDLARHDAHMWWKILAPIGLVALLTLAAGFSRASWLDGFASALLWLALAVLAPVAALATSALILGTVVGIVPSAVSAVLLLLALVAVGLGHVITRAPMAPGLRAPLCAGVLTLLLCPLVHAFFVREGSLAFRNTRLLWPFWIGLAGWALMLIGTHGVVRERRRGTQA